VDVADYPNDGGPVLDIAGKDAASDGALIRPFAFGEGAVDDGDVALAIVGVGEVAAGEQRLPDGREVAGGDVVGSRD